MSRKTDNPARRRPVNLTIRADIMTEAKAYKINASREAEKAIAAAIKKAKEHIWLDENKDAIDAHNARVEKHGLLLTPHWLED